MTTMTTLIKTMNAVKSRLRRQQKNENHTISEEKKLKTLRRAAIGIKIFLRIASGLSPTKVRNFLRS